MSDTDPDGRAYGRLRDALAMVGVAAVVAAVFVLLGLSVWGFKRETIGTHVTECRFDAQGAYMKVRLNNLLHSSVRRKFASVDFYTKASHDPSVPAFEAETATYMTVAPHRHGTVVFHVLRSSFRPEVSGSFADQHPKEMRTASVPDDPTCCSATSPEVDAVPAD